MQRFKRAGKVLSNLLALMGVIAAILVDVFSQIGMSSLTWLAKISLGIRISKTLTQILDDCVSKLWIPGRFVSK